MKRKKIVFGMLVMILIFGMAVISCDDGNGGSDISVSATFVTGSNFSGSVINNSTYFVIVTAGDDTYELNAYSPYTGSYASTVYGNPYANLPEGKNTVTYSPAHKVIYVFMGDLVFFYDR